MTDHTPEVLQMSPVVGIVVKRPYILRYSSAIKINRRLITFYSWQYQVNYITTVTILHILSSNQQVYNNISPQFPQVHASSGPISGEKYCNFNIWTTTHIDLF